MANTIQYPKDPMQRTFLSSILDQLKKEDLDHADQRIWTEYHLLMYVMNLKAGEELEFNETLHNLNMERIRKGRPALSQLEYSRAWGTIERFISEAAPKPA